MVFNCVLCEKKTVYTTYICENCRRIKHLMNLYSTERIVEILDKVLLRTVDKQDLKIKEELKIEKYKIETKLSK
tara:strand:+ start:296 stop:517 length:222 start_codon:yes stop_codon:yes gene_type:complete